VLNKVRTRFGRHRSIELNLGDGAGHERFGQQGEVVIVKVRPVLGRGGRGARARTHAAQRPGPRANPPRPRRLDGRHAPRELAREAFRTGGDRKDWHRGVLSAWKTGDVHIFIGLDENPAGEPWLSK
jgi:hypothetical protein